jgi:predicted 3-demethylubiquinone-9 3-methyltransferase (glyoxalase superfamily)
MFTGKQCGRAEEAVTFYSSVFKNPMVDGILRYESGESPNNEGTIKHAQIALDGQKFMLMDSASEHGFNYRRGFFDHTLRNTGGSRLLLGKTNGKRRRKYVWLAEG